MPNLNIPFAGQTLILPAAYYADNVSGANLPINPITPPLIYLGYGYGQKPFTATTYTTANGLLSGIRGGPASGFVPFFFAPSPQLSGAQQVTFINVAPNTQGLLTLNSGVTGVINLTSTNYGLPSNLLQATVATGSQGGKKVTLYDGYSGATFSQDDLGTPFELAYTGSASGVTYSVTISGGMATTFAITSPNSGESINVPLGAGAYATVEQLVAYFNTTGFYSAVVLGQGTLPSSSLDAAATISLASGSPYTYVPVTATLNDIVFWMNNTAASGLATAAIASGIASVPAKAPTNITNANFTGATSVAPVLANYASGFTAALGVPGWAVFADSNSSSVIGLGVQHVATARQPNYGAWRRFFTGSTIGDTVTTTIGNAEACSSVGVTYVYPGIYAQAYNTNVNTLYGGLYGAAMVAGMICGNPPSTPMTNKQLNATGVEVALTLTAGGQLDLLQQNGVMPIVVPMQGGVPTIASDLTTWQSDSNPENVYNQQISCRDYFAYSMVNTLQPWAGSVADPLIETKILNATKATLNALMYNSGNANGVLLSWLSNTLRLVYNGQQQLAAISVAVNFVGQNRFVTMFVTVLPQASYVTTLTS